MTGPGLHLDMLMGAGQGVPPPPSSVYASSGSTLPAGLGPAGARRFVAPVASLMTLPCRCPVAALSLPCRAALSLPCRCSMLLCHARVHSEGTEQCTLKPG
jgi:hypothetical protein